jgi:galactokinase
MSADPALVARVTAAFGDRFGTTPDLVAVAPGRVNLIGEHTDYNEGFVLPAALGFATVVAAGAGGDAAEVFAADFGALDRFALDPPIERLPAGAWQNHVRGIASELVRRDIPLSGFRLAIGGDVPRGAGLSSSASLGVAVASTLAALARSPLGPTDLALIAQAAENHFVGTACGIMDQLVSAKAEQGTALLIDCRSLVTTPVAIPDDAEIVIVHSGVRRGLVESAYNERRAQCAEAARVLGVGALRDADTAMLEAGAKRLDPVAFRRARHVITENARTLECAAALAANDLCAVGRLMAASHASMRDDFEITVPAIDRLVGLIADAIGGPGGVRMTGGGFGGCVVALLPRDGARTVAEAVRERYRAPDGSPPQLWSCAPSEGLRIVR